MGIEKYSTTADNNATAGSVNFAEGQAPSTVNNSARQVMADVRTWYEDAEWLKLGENGSANAFSISFVSTTVFKFTSTDRRSLVPVGRRIKAGVGAGTIYGAVIDSSLSASDTQVTVAFDSGQLDASLSYISLGILSASNNSFPRNMDMSFSDITAATLAGGVIATQAQMETPSSTAVVVTPGRFQNHPGSAKAWVIYDSTGSIGASYNVDSVTDNGTGTLTPVWGTDFSSGNYVVQVTASHAQDGTTNNTYVGQVPSAGRAVGSANIVTARVSDGALTDVTATMVVAYGDQ